MNQTCHYSTGFPPIVLVFGSSTFDSLQAIADLLPVDFKDADSHGKAHDDHDNLLRSLWKASTEFQDSEAIHHLVEQNDFLGLKVGSYVLVRNNNATSKLDSKFLGPFEVLEQRDDANEHIFELRDLVQDTIRTQHLRNLVPLDIGYESALRAARQNAGEHIVTGVTGHSGDPRKTGSLFFNLQFDGLPEEYPTLFKDCK